jgi:DNA modification methylase
MEYLIRLITPKNGIVLDPFMGSGSTIIACMNLKIQGVGIELDEHYFKIADERIKYYAEKD